MSSRVELGQILQDLPAIKQQNKELKNNFWILLCIVFVLIGLVGHLICQEPITQEIIKELATSKCADYASSSSSTSMTTPDPSAQGGDVSTFHFPSKPKEGREEKRYLDEKRILSELEGLKNALSKLESKGYLQGLDQMNKSVQAQLAVISGQVQQILTGVNAFFGHQTNRTRAQIEEITLHCEDQFRHAQQKLDEKSRDLSQARLEARRLEAEVASGKDLLSKQSVMIERYKASHQNHHCPKMSQLEEAYEEKYQLQSDKLSTCITFAVKKMGCKDTSSWPDFIARMCGN